MKRLMKNSGQAMTEYALIAMVFVSVIMIGSSEKSPVPIFLMMLDGFQKYLDSYQVILGSFIP